MAGAALSNERLFCWEQVQAATPLFRISRVFAPQGLGDRLLPLYALFAVLEQLCSNRSDAELARRKLDWWRAECLQGEPGQSAHPILKEFMLLGAHAALDKGLLAALFDSVELRLDAEPPADLAALERLCRSVADPQCRLELALCAGRAASVSPALAATLPRHGLAQLFRESARSGQAGRFWWLPLNLQARHGVSRAQLERNLDAPEVRALFGDVLEHTQAWGGVAAEPEQGGEGWAAARHFVVYSHLQNRALRRLRNIRPTHFAAVFSRVGLMELVQAWRAARRVIRP
jgi:15-cis-phytoene synthase